MPSSGCWQGKVISGSGSGSTKIWAKLWTFECCVKERREEFRTIFVGKKGIF